MTSISVLQSKLKNCEHHVTNKLNTFIVFPKKSQKAIKRVMCRANFTCPLYNKTKKKKEFTSQHEHKSSLSTNR